jgi:hypothetical protein
MEKCSIASHKGNENQNATEIPSCPSPHQNGRHKEKKHQQALVKMRGKGTLTVGGNVNECSHSVWRFLRKQNYNTILLYYGWIGHICEGVSIQSRHPCL